MSEQSIRIKYREDFLRNTVKPLIGNAGAKMSLCLQQDAPAQFDKGKSNYPLGIEKNLFILKLIFPNIVLSKADYHAPTGALKVSLHELFRGSK